MRFNHEIAALPALIFVFNITTRFRSSSLKREGFLPFRIVFEALQPKTELILLNKTMPSIQLSPVYNK